MKILFQGGWKAGRDQEQTQEQIHAYCRALGKYIVSYDHEIVLTSVRDCDKIIADEVQKFCKEQSKRVKDHVLFLLPEREKGIPTEGRVKRIDGTRWWIEERTYFVQNSDIIIAIGGGRGTFDCVQKAFLASKPVFVASAIPSPSTNAWKTKQSFYKYLEDGDADIFDDLNVTPDEFFENAFRIINSLSKIRYPKHIFIVHGRDHHFKNSLVTLLKLLGFTPIVLQDEPSKSLTIIEKLERDTSKVGFGFVLYTPDDLGHLPNEEEQFRARQNVVFEHGLLIGLLGRERTCAIIKGPLDIPSDIHGMIHEQIEDFDRESLKVAKILKQAGYELDVSQLI